MINTRVTRQNRTDLADMLGKLGLKRGAEIGVRTGKYSETLCTRIKSLEKLYSIDPWDLVFEDHTTRAFLRHGGPDVFNKIYRQALRRLRKYPVCEMIKKTSLEAVRDFEYGCLDFVYIDGAHTFDYVMTDIIEWAKRVKKGGIVSGDDYEPSMFPPVVLAVDTYVKAHKIKTLNLMDPKDGDDYPVMTWWFEKQ